MNLEQASEIAGIAAAFGVIASLLYLAIQVRQNTVTFRINTGQSLNDGPCGFFRYAAQGDTVDVIFRGFQGLDNLIGWDRMHFCAIMHDHFFAYQNAYFQMKSSALEKELWKAALAHMKHVAGFPDVRGYWSERRNLYIDELTHFVDAEVIAKQQDKHFNLAGIQFERQEASR